MLGTTIAHYQITAKLGQGGMGEVYRATDTKLDREVALKVLPSSFASTPERLARFRREAKALAQVNHTNVASVFGFDQHEDVQFLVMECVEGEDLATRLKQGRMPVEEALETCRQIAEALEAAHERGVVHRDLKPSNVMLTGEGQVKVLDFGLAKSLADESSNSAVGRASSPRLLEDDSPTITDAFTQPGVILGTAGYMSPEQAKGKPVDARTDVWAFGCVLFECLSGARLFQGEDVTETLASIIKTEPDWEMLPSETPSAIERLLRRCLCKDRKNRLHAIADARIELAQALTDPQGTEDRDRHPRDVTSFSRRGLLLLAGAMVMLVGVMVFHERFFVAPISTPSVKHVSLNVKLDGSLIGGSGNGTAVRLSPDGETLAYIVDDGGIGRSHIYLRRFDSLDTKKLESSAGAIDFCFSPGGEWIAFRVRGGKEIRKLSVLNDGPSIRVCDTPFGRGIAWSKDDGIVFAAGRRNNGLARVREGGSDAPQILTTASGETHRWPYLMPDHKTVLFTSHTNTWEGYDDARIMACRLPGGEIHEVMKGGYQARYLRSGHLVFIRDSTLFAAPFDEDRLEILGEPKPVLYQVATRQNGVAHYDISADGTLVYLKGDYLESHSQLDWIDRQGKRQPTPLKGMIEGFSLSPDGRQLAFSERDRTGRYLHLYDFERGDRRQLTFGVGGDDDPIWSPTGGSIVFRSIRDTDSAQGVDINLYWMRVTDSDEPHLLLDRPGLLLPLSWSGDSGERMIVREYTYGSEVKAPGDLIVLELAGDDEKGWELTDSFPFRETPFEERSGSLSPEGDWLAYSSDEVGGDHIMVRAFPGGEKREQVSMGDPAEFGEPLWNRNAPELVFAAKEGGLATYQLFTAKFEQVEGALKWDPPLPWEGAVVDRIENRSAFSFELFDLHPDGQRVLVRRRVLGDDAKETFSHVMLFEGFHEYLKQQLSTK